MMVSLFPGSNFINTNRKAQCGSEGTGGGEDFAPRIVGIFYHFRTSTVNIRRIIAGNPNRICPLFDQLPSPAQKNPPAFVVAIMT